MNKIGRIALLLTAAALVLASGDSEAVKQPDHLAGMPEFQVAGGPKARQAVSIGWHRVPRAALRDWAVFQNKMGGGWQASWDQATGTPSRIIGPGLHVPGSIASADTASAFSHQFLAEHIGLLAPGASASDFVQVSNHLGDGMRTVGFFQYHRGLRVVGGQVSFRFKNDRIFVIASEALPHVHADSRAKATKDYAANAARQWVLSDMAGSAQVGSISGPYVLPIVGGSRVLAYHTVLRVTVDAQNPIGRWDVYIDNYTGRAIARQQTLHFADGTLMYNAPVRRPTSTRQNYPANRVSTTINGGAVTAGFDGSLSWSGDAAGNITLGASGPRVTVANDAGDAISEILSIVSGGTLVWNQAENEQADAQLTAYVHGRIVQEYVRSFAPDLAFVDDQLPVTVNIDDSCNAFSDGTSINFFQSSDQCDNTGLLADVIYHEYGHSMHSHAIIEGAGAFDGAFSEGLSDYLSGTMQDDPGMGRGFFYSNDALRHMDPADSENVWPKDIGEIHITGIIFAGAMWDLRKTLVKTYGDAAGVALADRLFYAAVQRASNIPSTYVEVLAADDDNGDLTDGTPNECAINAAFGAHGLRAISAEISPLSVEQPTQAGWDVSVSVLGLATNRCPGDGVDFAQLAHRTRKSDDTPRLSTMVDNEGTFTGTIPEYAGGQVVNFQVELTFIDGSKQLFPSNPADPWYEFYVGEVETLYCNDFEDADPFTQDWTHELASGEMRDGADDWMWGPPAGSSGSGDPSAAFGGNNVIGNDLGGGEFNGAYQPNKINFAQSPVIDVGAYSDVRLQYRRWLNVEDAFFDKGTIYANGQTAWRNRDSDQGNSSATHHQDGEWRFHDVPLSKFITDGMVQIKFEIDSDGGLEMGGWTIDDFCIVAANGSVCGDGEVTGAEQCDNGDDNSDVTSDACRSNCRPAMCGDGVVDGAELCDDGNDANGDECTNTCDGSGLQVSGTGGCCQATGSNLPPLSGILLVVGLVALLTRRRRRDV